jgi:hypothetical protein
MCLFAQKTAADPGILRPLAWLGLLPRVVHERGAVRRAAARALALAQGLTGYVALHRVPPEAFSWLDLPEREDLFTSDAIGGAPTFLADARRAGLRVYTAPWRVGEDERWAQTFAAIEHEPPDLAFLYVTLLDGVLHRFGNDSPEARRAIDVIAGRIARAQEIMARGGRRLTTIVVGDHGMADIRRVVDPRPVMRRIGAERAFVDSTMVRFWGDDATVLRARGELERARLPGTWLGEYALRARRVPTAGAPYGRGMFVLEEGAMFAPSYLGGAVKGMHGYDLGTPSSLSALASDRPLPGAVRGLADVAGWIRDELSVRA